MKHEKALKAGIKVNIIVVAIFFSIVFAVSAVDATDVVVKVNPASQTVTPGDSFNVNVRVESVTYMAADQATLNFDPGAMSVSSVTEGDFLKSAGTTIGAGMEIIDNDNGKVTFFYSLFAQYVGVDGSGTLTTIYFDTDASAEGIFDLELTDVLLGDGDGNEITADAISNETVTISSLTPAIDTGPGTYPGIFGMHNGTIIPNQTITVSKLYTYPCSGTGGHAEYARIWNSSLDTNATWNGYIGDWHNISFNKTFTLVANKTYNYTIRTGSYPQIIHNQTHTTLDGSFINCTKFTDANGKEYNNWIPAIKLWM